MTEESNDAVGIITGGSRGIGKACVKLFASKGYKVVFCALHEDKAEGEAVEATTNVDFPNSSRFIPCDVTIESEVQKLVEDVVEAFGHIDYLVNCAGWHPPSKPIDNFSSEEFLSLFTLNVLGSFLLCKYSLPYLRKTHGSIVNISSLVASIGQERAVTYVATKGAVEAMTKALAIDEAANQVRVNSVAPGNVWTPLMASYISSSENPEAMTKFLCDSQHIQRMASGEEIAKAVLFLVSEATYCTGSVLKVTGGAELGYGRKRL